MRIIFPFLLLLFLLGSCDEETRRLHRFEVHGIDVSHYQSQINWDKVAQQDVHFAFIKATEGETYADSIFCRNWSELNRVNIQRGAYHFFRPSLDAEQQARNFAEWVDLDFGDLPPVLDVEVLDGMTNIELINGMRTWLYMTEIKYGIKPIIYTNLKFYYKYLAGHFDDYPIWIARYSPFDPKLPAGKEWLFWQYGNKGKLPGIHGDVDFNVFSGTLEELRALGIEPREILSSR